MAQVIHIRAKERFNFGPCLRINASVENPRQVRFAHSGNFNFGDGPFFISQWIYVGATGNGTIFAKNSGAAGYNALVNSGLGISANFYRVGSGQNGNFDTAGGLVQRNAWNHIAMGRIGVNNAENSLISNYRVYVNGRPAPITNTNWSHTNANFDNNLFFGIAGTTSGFWDVYMDEMIFIDNFYSAEEVLRTYNNSRGAYIPRRLFNNVRGYWPFNHQNGKVVQDYSMQFNPALTTSQNGLLTNFTDAETAANGQPQSGNTAWCNHIINQVPTPIKI